MEENKYEKILEDALDEAERLYRENGTDFLERLDIQTREDIGEIADKALSGYRKAVANVVITSLTKKIGDPDQDIRYHQQKLEGGYSGRSLDEKIINPFLIENDFQHMAESGWLTRSLEQSQPYIKGEYTGEITPGSLKESFLRLLHRVEEEQLSPQEVLIGIFLRYIEWREDKKITLTKPSNISIKRCANLVRAHLFDDYTTGSAPLPVLVIYSIYEVLMSQVDKYSDKKLLPLKSHTTSDRRAGALGDIEIVYEEDPESRFEAIEIKHERPIKSDTVRDAYEKFRGEAKLERYYILSTGGIEKSETEEIKEMINGISIESGKEVIVNGVIPSLRYYLRLIDDPDKFIEKYTENLEEYDEINYEHRKRWNEIPKEI